MGIGTNKEHVLGRNQVLYVNQEATAGTFVKPAATDCIRAESTSIKYEPGRESLNEGSEYPDEVERLSTKSKITWQAVCDLIPSGTAATAPRLSDLLTAAIGANNSGSGSKWVYTQAASQNLPTFTIVRRWSTLMMEAIWGAMVSKMTLKLSGGKRAQVTFDGQAMGYRLTGPATVNGQMITTASMAIHAAEDNLIGVNSVVKIASDDNSGAGYAVTAGTTSPYTLETTVSAADDAVVVPFAPAPTWLGSPLHGISGAFTLGGVTFPITDFEVTQDLQLSLAEDEFGVETFSDAIPGRRKVSGSFACRVRKDLMYLIANRRDFGTVALLATAGTATGSRYKVSVPQAELGYSEVTAAGDKEVTITIPYTGLATSAGNNSLQVDHD